MRLFLIRHTSAIEKAKRQADSDDHCYITSEGRIIARRFFAEIRKSLSNIEHICTSPLTRAVQTAEILAGVIEFNGDIELADELRNESSITSVISLISRNSTLNDLALVGHEPKMSILLNSICGSNSQLNGFAKCGVAIIDYLPASHSGRLLSYIDPKKIAVS
jgi:phosphohistidine phosphatase